MKARDAVTSFKVPLTLAFGTNKLDVEYDVPALLERARAAGATDGFHIAINGLPFSPRLVGARVPVEADAVAHVKGEKLEVQVTYHPNVSDFDGHWVDGFSST